MATVLTIRTYPDAQNALRENLTVFQREHHPDFTAEVIDRLVRYVFGLTKEDCFWRLVCWFKTLEPHDSTWHTDYISKGGATSEVRKRTVESALNQIKKGINYFCEADPLLNDTLDLLDKRYHAQLQAQGVVFSLPRSYNLITELRGAIKASEDEIFGMIQRGRPETRDYLLEYLLTVSQHVFPSVSPTGDPSNTFCRFAQAVFSACFFYEGNPRPVSASGLKSRVEKCLGPGKKRFEYSAAIDSFIATEEMKVETAL
jgi:hypothetical protein